MGKSVITIGRQYGSGGREIGRILAKQFDIPFYDNKLLEVAARDSGIDVEFFKKNDEKPVNSLLYVLSNSYNEDNLPFNHKLFIAQFDAVRKLADQGPCVFVGRCADYALKGRDNVINVFIHANMQNRVERAINEYGLPEKNIEANITKIDKQRASYYSFYTCDTWGKIENYDLSFSSSAFGIEKSVEFIKSFIDLKENSL